MAKREAHAEFWQSEANGKWYMHRVAGNGEITDPSQGYTAKSSVLRAIRSRWPGIREEWVEDDDDE